MGGSILGGGGTGGGGLTEVVAANVNSEASTDGQVLTSDGAGNAVWEDVASCLRCANGHRY